MKNISTYKISYNIESDFPRTAILIKKEKQMGEIIIENYISNKMEHQYRGNVNDTVLAFGTTFIILINIYNPTGATRQQNIIQERITEYLQNLENFVISKYQPEKILKIIGGDFNNVLDELISPQKNEKKIENEKTKKIRKTQKNTLHKMVTAHNLADPFFHFNSTAKKYTNRGTNGTNRRLDRFYVSSSIYSKCFLSQKDILGKRSTHSSIFLKFNLSFHGIKLGPKRFRLPKKFIPLISKNVIFSKLSSSSDLVMMARILADQMGDMIRKIDRKNKIVQELQNDIYGQLNKVFKPQMTRKPIESFLSDGVEIKKNSEMLLHATQYYQELFTDKSIASSKEIEEYIFANIGNKRLKDADSLKLNLPITEEEVKNAIWQANPNSEPGLDGIPYTFYKAAWESIKVMLVKEFNIILETGQIPISFSSVIINLILKPKKKENNIENYRPISLINTNMRILAIVMNNRVLNHLPEIIGKEQTGFVPNRTPFEQIGTFKQLFSSMKPSGYFKTSDNAKIFQMDLNKAFDRILHKYISCLLKVLNFGENFLKMIVNSLRASVALLDINGYIGPQFRLGCGTLQGNPLSPTLFILALQP
ncbi:MAG TPA: reverse transcriptase domain-containing protein, partial [Hanamia sp.]|nr:reverse transcriptase domain-containing protein [Hanamia sp.]